MSIHIGKPFLQKITPGTDQLWLAVVLAGLGFFISLVPLPPNDFWWHLKVGEHIYTTGSIPKTNLFAWTLAADHPFVYGAWLSEWLFFLIYRWGGLSLVIFTRTFLAVAAFSLVGCLAYHRSDSWRLASLAVALSGCMTLNNLPVRPQIWSWLPFMAFVILLDGTTHKRLKPPYLLFLPAIMVFWVNAHGAYVLGIVLAGIYCAGEAMRTALKQPGALNWRCVGWICLAAGLSILALLANPQFSGITSYVYNLMTDLPSQQLIIEWQSPTPKGIPNTLFFASIVLLMVTIAYTKYKPTPTEILLVGAFTWLGFNGQRYVVWYGMVAMPILIRAMKDLPVNPPRLVPQYNLANLAIALALFLPVVSVQPWFVEKFPLPQQYWNKVWQDATAGPLISIETPLAAIEYLKANPGGHIFNEMGYGSYMIWAVPEQRVFIDPRVELYPFEQWQDYIQITRGARYNEILSRYGADRIFLDLELQEHLAASLEEDPGWRLEYQDERAQIWSRNK